MLLQRNDLSRGCNANREAQTWCHQCPFWSKSWQWWQVLNPMDPSPLDYSKWALSQFERNIQAKQKKCFLKLQAIKPQKPNVLFWCYFSVYFPPTVPLRNLFRPISPKHHPWRFKPQLCCISVKNYGPSGGHKTLSYLIFFHPPPKNHSDPLVGNITFTENIGSNA